jgi:hypothetical protein
MTTTDASGNYTFIGIPGGNNYTLTPSKTGGVNGVESFDAAQTVRFVAGLDIPTNNQRVAGDADGDTVLTSFDASLTARYVTGLPGFGNVSTWSFVPANRAYPSLAGNQSNQDFTAILIGEVTGNWTASGPDGESSYSPTWIEKDTDTPLPSDSVTVALPSMTAAPGSTIIVPVNVTDLTNRGVMALDLDVVFDPSIMQPQLVPFDTDGTLAAGMLVTANTADPGHLIVSAFQTTDIAGSGKLIYLRFSIVGASGQATALGFEDYTDENGIVHPAVRLNAGTPFAATVKGSVRVSAISLSDGSSEFLPSPRFVNPMGIFKQARPGRARFASGESKFD